MRRVMAVAAALGVLALGGAAAAAQTIKVGVAVSLTGRFSREGKLVHDGYELWRDEVNARGLTVGGKREKVDLVFYDDESDPHTAANLTERLITQDKVQFLLGPQGSPITEQTSVIGEKYKVITIAPTANSDPIYEKGFKYIFSVLPPATAFFRSVLAMGPTLRPRPVTLAILAANQAFALLAAKGAEAIAKGSAYDVVYSDRFPVPANDLSAFLTQVKAKNPDMLLVAGFFQEALLVTKQAKELKLCPKVMAFSVGPEIPDFSQSLGKDANFVVGNAWWLPNMGWKGPGFGSSQTYGRLVEQRFHHPAVYHSAAGSAAGLLLQLAIERAGSTETDKVRDALLAMDVETFWGPTKWDASGQNVKGGQGVIQIQDGKIAAVYPKRIQEKAPIYPMPCWDKRG